MTSVTPPPTGLRAYRAVLAVPALRRLTAVAFFVRIPATATAITLTAAGVFWALAPGLAYPVLLGAALPSVPRSPSACPPRGRCG